MFINEFLIRYNFIYGPRESNFHVLAKSGNPAVCENPEKSAARFPSIAFISTLSPAFLLPSFFPFTRKTKGGNPRLEKPLISERGVNHSKSFDRRRGERVTRRLSRENLRWKSEKSAWTDAQLFARERVEMMILLCYSSEVCAFGDCRGPPWLILIWSINYFGTFHGGNI